MLQITTKEKYGGEKIMISNYIIKWGVKEVNPDSIEGKINFFNKMLFLISKTFTFQLSGAHTIEKDMNFYYFDEGSTDWFFDPQDRTFNMFYTKSIKDLNLEAILLNESKKILLEPNCLYCMPYWMSYKFSSEIKHKQELINLKLLTETRPKLIANGTLW